MPAGTGTMTSEARPRLDQKSDRVDAALPFVSVVMPCRNEERFIEKCLASILATDYPADRFEVLVVDGMSDDRTRDLVRSIASREPRVQLVDNPARTTPFALNTGIDQAKGDVVMRMDAHAEYPSHYIRRLVEWQVRTGADNVGGTWETKPGADTPIARAIALALAHPLGVGNAWYRLGVTEPKFVDTVPFGCYRREVFERIGRFDPELSRNQDDEFNLRLIRRGGRILLVPDVSCRYHARDSYGKLARMYYQYGYFKPLVARKLGAVLTLRQLVPSGALLVGAALLAAAPWSSVARVGAAAAFGLYLAAVAWVAAGQGSAGGWRTKLGLVVAFPVIHGSYALGFLRGVLDFVIRRRRPDQPTLSR
jgi:glycosyltransferase involved in cell wall biosynthesis